MIEKIKTEVLRVNLIHSCVRKVKQIVHRFCSECKFHCAGKWKATAHILFMTQSNYSEVFDTFFRYREACDSKHYHVSFNVFWVVTAFFPRKLLLSQGKFRCHHSNFTQQNKSFLPPGEFISQYDEQLPKK